MDNSVTIERMENELGIVQPKVTREQLQAAYALNLCAVSVSQIIDYNDINVLEQEYDAILNNLNLEHIPKDEALLEILKRLLETITFFRIQEGEKVLIEKEYQQKMRNAIWNAMPNPGALIATGLSSGGIGLAMSLAASVGTAYMNYRKNRAEYQTERDKQYWELRKTAMEQFQSLQQQLFETSWRLAEKYEFPDAIRLSERQIKQYNSILMDEDEIRKFERLESIKDKFIAYPPFWYFLGNTANSISMSEHYGLDSHGKKHYRNYARTCFEYFRIINKYDLLREDGITASCYLEYIDLLDAKKDGEKIEELLIKAVQSAGNSMDILQLCAMAYVKIENLDKASYLLRQLVNEQYNEITNAQILSAVYVNKCIKMQSLDARNAYKILEARVPEEYLFPMPTDISSIRIETLNNEFVKTQRRILKTKYKLVLIDFIKKYEALLNRIIPVTDDYDQSISDDVYALKKSARTNRIKQVELMLYSGSKSDSYKAMVQNIAYSYEVLKILNKLFGSICLLDCIQEEDKQLELKEIIEKGIHRCKDELKSIDSKITNFDEKVYAEAQEITIRKITNGFFLSVARLIIESVDAKSEMRDFTIAEYNLVQFCQKEGIDEPEILFAHKDDAEIEETTSVYFTPDLIGETTIRQNDRIQKNRAMVQAIKDSEEDIVVNKEGIEFYTQEDPRMNRYFHEKKYKDKRTMTLAVLDDRTKGDMDLLFTTEGLVPIIKGKCKNSIPYENIGWSKNTKKKELEVGLKYSNEKNLDMDKLYDLIKKLQVFEMKKEKYSDVFL